MKILHTSDWHLGKKLAGYKFYEEFNLFVDFLLETIEKQKIDILLIAGDIFDIAFPSNQTLEHYFDILLKLSESNLKKTIIIGGNHDSPSTLDVPKKVLSRFNIQIVSAIDYENLDNHIIPIPQNNPEVVFCAVPYPREKEIKATADINYTNLSREQILRNKIANIYKQLAEKIEVFEKQNIPVFATGHLFISETNVSDAQKVEYIGGLTDIPLKLLPENFDFYLLGHVHKHFILKNKFIYSGTPVQLNFNEDINKFLIVIDTQTRQINKIKVPVFREKVVFSGNLKEIENQIISFKNQGKLKPISLLNVKEKSFREDILLQIETLKQKFADKIQILDFRIFSEQTYQNLSNNLLDKKFSEITPMEIFENILKIKDLDLDTQQKISQIFKEIYNQTLEELKENYQI